MSLTPTTARSTTLRTVLLVVGSVVIAIIIAVAAARVAVALTREDSSGTFEIGDDFDAIELRTSASDVTIGFGDVARPVLEFRQGDRGGNITLEHSVVGSTLRVEVGHRGWFPWGFDFGGDDSHLDLVLPASYGNGRIAVDADSTAGDIDLAGRFGTVALEATAGDVRLIGGATELSLDTTAGDVEVRKFALRGSLTGSSTAGDVSYEFSTIPDSANVESTAGNIEFTVPEGDYRIVTETTAGEVDSRVTNDADADRTFEFHTTAGDVRITNG